MARSAITRQSGTSRPAKARARRHADDKSSGCPRPSWNFGITLISLGDLTTFACLAAASVCAGTVSREQYSHVGAILYGVAAAAVLLLFVLLQLFSIKAGDHRRTYEHELKADPDVEKLERFTTNGVTGRLFSQCGLGRYSQGPRNSSSNPALSSEQQAEHARHSERHRARKAAARDKDTRTYLDKLTDWWQRRRKQSERQQATASQRTEREERRKQKEDAAERRRAELRMTPEAYRQARRKYLKPLMLGLRLLWYGRLVTLSFILILFIGDAGNDLPDFLGLADPARNDADYRLPVILCGASSALFVLVFLLYIFTDETGCGGIVLHLSHVFRSRAKADQRSTKASRESGRLTSPGRVPPEEYEIHAMSGGAGPSGSQRGPSGSQPRGGVHLVAKPRSQLAAPPEPPPHMPGMSAKKQGKQPVCDRNVERYRRHQAVLSSSGDTDDDDDEEAGLLSV